MEVTHTIDLTRLPVLEAIKTSALGAAQGGRQRVEDLYKKLADKERQLAFAKNALDQERRVSREVVSEGGGFITRWKNQPDPLQGQRAQNVLDFENACEAIRTQIKEAQAAQAADFERFNEASHLLDACKKFSSEYLRDGSAEE